MGSALVMAGDGVSTLPDGTPEIRSLFFDAADSKVLDTWHVMGLSGTGSHDVAVEDLFVPADRTTCVFTERPRHDGALYRFPIFGLLATGVCSVGLGIAQAALGEITRIAKTKRSRGGQKQMTEQEHVQLELATATGELSAARAYLHTTLDAVWQRAHDGAALSDRDRAELRLAATHAAGAAAQVVRRCYELGGGASPWLASPLQRHFRDVHVMTQHVMVGAQTKKPIGRILLDLPTRTADL
jgi:alkylation response protein AidB-like acyl-CoA dehydrogenase